jgi:glycosyltransferase involved in cell wall biosynthesis
MDLVSVVIPCYNPGPALCEAVRSARRQTHRAVEVILVNDGTDTDTGRAAIESALSLVDQYIEQPNQGVSSARNRGFRAAKGRFFVPLDSDDLLNDGYVADCLAAIAARPEAAFVYTDCRVFGKRNYVERHGEYNLYTLLDRNTLPYVALIREERWRAAGGYDERMRWGNENWEFWLRLGAKGSYGQHLGKVLFRYLTCGPPLSDVALHHDQEAQRYIRENHPELYGYEARASIKRAWEPAVCVVGPSRKATILDCQTMEPAAPAQILLKSPAQAFAITPADADPSAAEFAALAVWAGGGCIRLADGTLAASRQALARCGNLGHLVPDHSISKSALVPVSRRSPGGWLMRIFRHLLNAGVLSARSWLEHPMRSALRLVPLRVKEKINRGIGPVFDLSFYLQFQPASVILGQRLEAPLRYYPQLGCGRRRVALVTPHLGPGGAETVLLEVADALDRARFEMFLISTQSLDGRWIGRWNQAVDHVYDLAALAPPGRVPGVLFAIIRNWQFETVLIQNSLAAYSILREVRAELPQIRIMDLVHSVDPEWDVISSTREIANDIDVRIAISEAVRTRFLQEGVPERKIRLIRNGIDLSRFTPDAPSCVARLGRILFVGRLDEVKRPLLLVGIARALKELRGKADFRIIVAGDGPTGPLLRTRIDQERVSDVFDLLGHVPDIAPLIKSADLLLLTSRAEGIPLAILEAFAAGKPVVVSSVGAVRELVDHETGVLIEKSTGETELFAHAISRLLDSPGLREAMGREARRKVETQYGRERFRQSYRDLFDEPR